MVGGGLQGVSKGSNLIVWLIKLTDINEWKNLTIEFGHLSSIVNSISIIVLLKLTIWLLNFWEQSRPRVLESLDYLPVSEFGGKGYDMAFEM